MDVGFIKRKAASALGFLKAENFKVNIEQSGDSKMVSRVTNPQGQKPAVETLVDGKTVIEMDSPDGTKMRATSKWDGTTIITTARDVNNSKKGIDIVRSMQGDGTMKVVLTVVGGKSEAVCKLLLHLK